MIEQKKNDWLATLFLSPDKSVQDLANLGINTDNSSIQNIDYYKKISQIQEAFKKNDGTFDDASFKKYYDGVLTLYNEADRANLSANIMDFYDYDPVDYFAPVGGNVRDVAPKIIQFANPLRQSRGLIGFNELSAPTMSIREVAQTNKVFNVENNKFEDWTPNEWGGLSAITRPTLVLAQWDTDGTHEVNGRIVSHKAGDLKFNDSGDPYYETLGNRDVAGKEILHVEDTLTIDGNKWNKYDVFDSDNLDKNVGSVIAKTVLKLAPALIPGFGIYYGGLTAALEIGKLIPMLYKGIAGIATGDLSNSKSAQSATDVYAWFSRFDSSLSDKGKSSFFNWENIGQIIGDSSKQLFQQRAIGSIPGWIAKIQNKPISENAIKWGRGLSLAYMAGTSSMDSFDAFKAAGASDRVAGFGMLSTMGAMYGLMNTDYFKDYWFKGTYLDRGQSRAAIQKIAEQSRKSFANQALDKADAKTAAKWIQSTSKKLEGLFTKIKSSDIISGSINEGIEETVEEISMDAVKGFYSALNHLGLIDKQQEYDFGLNVQDMLSRYLASAVGGAIGGAVFSAQGKWEKSFYGEGPKDRWEQIREMGDGFGEIVYLYRQGRGAELKKELDRYYRNGKLGSANLSGLKYKLVKDDKGVSKIQYEGANESDSQNDIAYKQISNFFDWIEDTMTEEGLKISDEELDHWIAYSQEKDPDVDLSNINRDDLKKLLKEDSVYNQVQTILGKGISSQLYSDWNTLTEQIITTKAEMEKMLSPKDGEKTETKDIEDKKKALEKNSEYQKLKEELKSLRNKRDEILRGEKSDYYFGQWRFAITPSLANLFVNGFGLHNYVKYFHGKNWEEIESDDIRRSIKDEYESFSKLNEKQQILKAYDMFNNLQEKFGSKFLEIVKKSKDSSKIFRTDTIYENVLAYTNLQIQLLENQKINATEEEIKKIDTQIEELKKQKEYNELNPLQRFVHSLTKEGELLLQRPVNINDSNGRNLYFSSYLDLMKKAIEDGYYMDKIDPDLINVGRTYIEKFLNGDEISNLEKTIYSKFNEFFLNQPDPRFIFNDLFEEDNWNRFIRPIIDILHELSRGDFKEALKIYNNFKSQDLALTILEEDWKMVIDSIDKIFPNFIDGQPELNIQEKSFESYLNEVIEYKSKIRKSPVYELLSELEKILGRDGEEIVKLIENEFDNFMNSPTTEDYVIQNKSNLERLKEVSGLLVALESLVIAAGGSYNVDLNKYREKLGKELFPEIDSDLKRVLDSDIVTLKSKLDTLLEIVEANGEKNLKKQQEIEENMRKKFIFLLAGNTDLSKSFSEIFDFDLDEIFKNIGVDRSELESYEIEQLHSIGVKLETEIYKAISSKNLSIDDIVEKLFNTRLFDGNVLIKNQTTKLTSDKNQQITQFDQLMYLASIISTPSQNFELKLKKLLKDGKLEKAPIFSQVYAAKLAYANIKNSKLFNAILRKLKDIAKQNPEDYLKTKSVFSNMIFISGGAGVGKSTGVGYLINKMFEDDCELVTCAPSEDQITNLNQALNSKNSHKSLTKDKLIESIIGTQISTKELINNDHIRVILDSNGKKIGYTLKTVSLKENDVFTENQTRLLIIDEIGVFNRIELEIISKWAAKNNIFVVGLGDYKQNGGMLTINGVHEPTSIEDGFVIKSPELTASLRVQNIAQSDNYILLSSVLGQIYDHHYEHPELDNVELDTYVNEYLSKNRLKLKYFNQNGFFAGGTKIITKPDIETYVKELSKLGNVAIISDDVDKYSMLKSDSVSVWTPYDVQGREFDYVIIDKKLPSSYLTRLKDIYTLSQRARKGSVFAFDEENGLFASTESESASGNIQVTETQIENYKKWKLQLMSGISEDFVEERIPEDKTVNPEPEEENGDEQHDEENKVSNQFSTEPDLTKKSTETDIQDQIIPEQNELTPNLEDLNKKSNSNESSIDFSPSTKPVQNEKPKNNLNNTIISSGQKNRETATKMFSASEIKIGSDPTKLIWTDYFVNESGVSLFSNREFNSRQIWNHVRAYFLYKHDLDPNFTWPTKCSKFFIGNQRENLIKLSKFLKNKNSSYRIERLDFGKDSEYYICKVFEVEGKTYVLPLIVAPDNLKTTGDFNFNFKIKNTEESFVSRQSGVKNQIEFSEDDIYESDCIIHNTPVTLVETKSEKEELKQSLQRDSIDEDEKQNIEWRLKNNGNSFIIVSSDPLSTSEDFQNFLQSGEKMHATQKTLRSPFRLFGINAYVKDLKELLKLCENESKLDNIISKNQAGRLIGSIYVNGNDEVKNIFKNWIKNQIFNWTKSRTFRIKVSVRKNDNKDVVDFIPSFEYDFKANNAPVNEFFEALDQMIISNFNESKQSDIMFEFMHSRDGNYFDTIDVEHSNIFNSETSLMTRLKNHIDNLNPLFQSNGLQKYKYGIVVNDKIYSESVRNKISENWFYIDTKEDLYYTARNIVNYNGCDFEIELNQTIESDQNELICDQYNQFLEQNGVIGTNGLSNRRVTSLNELSQIINEINNDIRQKTNFPTFKQLSIEGDKLSIKLITDYEQLLRNHLKSENQEIREIFQNSIDCGNGLKYQSFVVSLPNKTIEYIWDEGWKTNEKYSSEHYMLKQALNSKVIENDSVREMVKIFEQFGNGIVFDLKLTRELIDKYKRISINGYFNNVKTIINNLLLKKLENGEC